MAKRICTLPNCTDPHLARGFCSEHYHRNRRTGSPYPPPAKTNEESFWEKVNKDGPIPDNRPDLGNCWIWKKGLNADGYGQFCVNSGRMPAHRFGYELFAGPIPEGLVIDHLCRTPACIRWTHLDPVPQVVNMERGNLRQALQPYLNRGQTIGQCPQGHPYDSVNAAVGPNGRRYCRACKREKVAAMRARNPEECRRRDTEGARRRRAEKRAAAA